MAVRGFAVILLLVLHPANIKILNPKSWRWMVQMIFPLQCRWFLASILIFRGVKEHPFLRESNWCSNVAWKKIEGCPPHEVWGGVKKWPPVFRFVVNFLYFFCFLWLGAPNRAGLPPLLTLWSWTSTISVRVFLVKLVLHICKKLWFLRSLLHQTCVAMFHPNWAGTK